MVYDMLCRAARVMSPSLNTLTMNENTESGGRWGQNIALFAIIAVAIALFVVWLCNKSGQDKADLAASIQKLYGQMEWVIPEVNKTSNRVDAIGVGLAKTSQSLADFQDCVEEYMGHRRCGNGNNNGCGQTRFVKTTPYTAGTTTLEETDTCCNG